MARKIDWEKIKTEYITTDISVRKLSEKHKIPNRSLAIKVTNEKWVSLKKQHKERVVKKAVQKTEKSKVFNLAQEMVAADMLSKAVMECLNDPQQFLRYVVNEGTGKGKSVTSEKVFDKFDTRAMRDLALTLNSVSNLKKDLNNVLSEKDRIMTELAQQKLEIEKMRLELERQRVETNDNKEITVTITDDLKRWAE